MQRKEDAKHAAELITIRNSLERRNNNNDCNRDRDRDGRGGDGDREAKKVKREKERTERQERAKAKSTEEDKAGDIISSGFLKLPKLSGGKMMCDAYYRQYVACFKTVMGKACDKCHTPVNQMSKEDQKIVFDYVEGTNGISFNPKTVTCFRKEDGRYVRPE